MGGTADYMAAVDRVRDEAGQTPFAVYSQAVGRNMRGVPELGLTEQRLAGWALGLTGEAGEVADLIKKVCFQGHPLDAEAMSKLAEELGDVLFYATALCRELGLLPDSVMLMNMGKIAKRYPGGFTPEASRQREDANGADAQA